MYIGEYVTKYVAYRFLSFTERHGLGFFLVCWCPVLFCRYVLQLPAHLWSSSHLSHISLVSTVICFHRWFVCSRISPVLLCLFPVCSLCTWIVPCDFLVRPQFFIPLVYFSPPAFCCPPVCLVFVSRDTENIPALMRLQTGVWVGLGRNTGTLEGNRTLATQVSRK